MAGKLPSLAARENVARSMVLVLTVTMLALVYAGARAGAEPAGQLSAVRAIAATQEASSARATVIRDRGTWRKKARYRTGDLVAFKKKSYLALRTSRRKRPDRTTRAWARVRGATGPTGPTGVSGPAGPVGTANVSSRTFSLTSAEFLRNGIFSFATSPSSSIEYYTRHVDVSVPELTQDVRDRGMLQVSINSAPRVDYWHTLPATFLNESSEFYHTYQYEPLVGKVRVHFFFLPNRPGAVLPTLSTFTMPTLNVRVVVVPAA